ncbi:MAG: hypothetical protein ACR2RV_07730 [Verrucomicrobiales bacterium]
MRIHNLFDTPETETSGELVEVLAGAGGSPRIERIVSHGHASPDGFWYDQELSEWVVLLSGSAVLRFEDLPEPIRLKPGDWLEIPAHRRHRVEETDPAGKSVWLAVHWKDPVGGDR